MESGSLSSQTQKMILRLSAPASAQWPTCTSILIQPLRAASLIFLLIREAIVLLIKDTEKLTLCQYLTVQELNAVLDLTQYQGLLCKDPFLTLVVIKSLNSVMYLPIKLCPAVHDCSCANQTSKYPHWEMVSTPCLQMKVALLGQARYAMVTMYKIILPKLSCYSFLISFENLSRMMQNQTCTHHIVFFILK